MKTLYDLLGARPSDNAEALRAAFRIAAKANHPDLHAGDPYAAVRFRKIAEAYEILRDAERRATYDRLLQFERKRVAWKLKGTLSYLMHSVVCDAVTAICLAIVLAGGYLIYAHVSRPPAQELAGPGGRGSARIAVVQPDERRDGPEPNAGTDRILSNAVTPAATRALASPRPGGTVPGAAGLNAEVANLTNAVAVIVDSAGPNTATERPDQTVATKKLDQDNAQLVKVLSSSGERDDGGGKSLSSDFATAGDKRDIKQRETHDINAGDVKTFDTKLHETKTPPKARTAAKRQAAGHTTLEQASLENRSACSQSCARDVPPMFGVGF